MRGLINAIVGRDRRVVGPGTFVHAPAFARHSMKATEDGDLSYLYIKDKTWTVVGLAADQAVPDKAFTVDEINKLIDTGGTRKAAEGESQAVIEGLHECYYPLIASHWMRRRCRHAVSTGLRGSGWPSDCLTCHRAMMSRNW